MSWSGHFGIARAVVLPCLELGLSFEDRLRIYRPLVSELRSQEGHPSSYNFPKDLAWAVATTTPQKARERGGEDVFQGDAPAWAFRQLRNLGHEVGHAYFEGYREVFQAEREEVVDTLRYASEYLMGSEQMRRPLEIAEVLRAFIELGIEVPKMFEEWVLGRMVAWKDTSDWKDFQNLQSLLDAEASGELLPLAVY